MLSALFIVLLVGTMAFCASWQLPKFCSKVMTVNSIQWSRFYLWYRCDIRFLWASFL